MLHLRDGERKTERDEDLPLWQKEKSGLLYLPKSGDRVEWDGRTWCQDVLWKECNPNTNSVARVGHFTQLEVQQVHAEGDNKRF